MEGDPHYFEKAREMYLLSNQKNEDLDKMTASEQWAIVRAFSFFSGFSKTGNGENDEVSNKPIK